MNELNVSELNDLFKLDALTGKLYWLVVPSNNVRLGSEAGSLNKCTGYRAVKIKGKAYRQHRVVWAMLNGAWPEDEIDHINGIRDDNRPTNLRQASREQNTSNCVLYKTNTSGRRGVSWDKNSSKWKAQISLGGKAAHLGLFTCAEEAYLVYVEATKSHNAEFRRLA